MDLTRIPRELVYGTLFILLCIPFLVPWSLPVFVSTETRGVYEAVEEVAAEERDKPLEEQRVVFVLSSWGPGTQGENQPQLEAVVRHLIRQRLKFVVFASALDPLPSDMADRVILAEVELEQKRDPAYDPVDGVDYANLGFKGVRALTIAPVLQGLENDIHAFVVRDRRGRPLDELPIMHNLRRLPDTPLVITVSAGSEGEDVIGVILPKYPELRVASATMSIVATQMYSYVDSGQLVGLIDGLRGATEYKALLDPDIPPDTRTNALSVGRIFIILLVLVGNIGFAYEVRRRKVIAAPPPRPPIVTERAIVNRVVTIALGVMIAAAAVDLLIHRAAGAAFFPMRFGIWLAAVGTLGILTFLFGDNRLYRFLEHFIIGSALAYGTFEIIAQVIVPNWWIPMTRGFRSLGPGGGPYSWEWAYVFLLVPGSFWYFTYSKKRAWINKLAVSLFVGMTLGIAFGKFTSLAIPQVVTSFKPLVTHGPDGFAFTYANFCNLAFTVTVTLVMIYFIFLLSSKGRAVRGVHRLGRLVMMMGFGALFGNTVGTRLSWLIDRIKFLMENWLLPYGGGS